MHVPIVGRAAGRFLAARVGRLCDALLGLGSRLRDALATLAGEHAGDAARDAVRAALAHACPRGGYETRARRHDTHYPEGGDYYHEADDYYPEVEDDYDDEPGYYPGGDDRAARGPAPTPAAPAALTPVLLHSAMRLLAWVLPLCRGRPARWCLAGLGVGGAALAGGPALAALAAAALAALALA